MKKYIFIIIAFLCSVLLNAEEKAPVELNLSLEFNGSNSTFKVGVVCNETLGKMRLKSFIAPYEAIPNRTNTTWFENYIKEKWIAGKAYYALPDTNGIEVNILKGETYSYEYNFNWKWPDVLNSAYGFAYLQNPKDKSIILAKRSENILNCSLISHGNTKQKVISANTEYEYLYEIYNPTKYTLTYDIEAESSNILNRIALQDKKIVLTKGARDTIKVKFKTTPREQYGNFQITVTPIDYLNQYFVLEKSVDEHKYITDKIKILAVTDGIPGFDVGFGTDNWDSYFRNALITLDEFGKSAILINYDYWESNFSDIDYDVLFVYPDSRTLNFGIYDKLERIAVESINKGKDVLICSNSGLSVYKNRYREYRPTANLEKLFQIIGITSYDYINLKGLNYIDTLSITVNVPNALNKDIDATNFIVNSSKKSVKSVDHINSTYTNNNTFPILWFNREYDACNIYAGVATEIADSKVVYSSLGLETLAGEGGKFLMRNFLEWCKAPSNILIDKSNFLTVFPNPAGDFITVSMKPSEGFKPSEGSAIDIYNTLGEKVMSVGMKNFSSLQRINISDLPKGIYFVKMGGETAKFVKM